MYLWRMRETIFHDKRNRKILDRFKWLEDLFKEMEATTVVYQPSGDETQVFVNNTLVNNRDGQNPDNGYFACEADGMAAQGALKGVENMAWSYPGFMEIINKIGYLLGGFDHSDEGHQMKEEFRIVSNTIKDGHDRNSLVSVGQSRHPSSNFADNNYFFNVISVTNEIRNGSFNPNESKLVLRYPHGTYYGNQNEKGFWEKAEKSQKDALNTRFPYKFLYAWTHRDSVLHFTGLKAYRNLVWQKEQPFRYHGDADMNQPYADFANDNGWKSYTNQLIELIPQDERGDEAVLISELSKLLSIIFSTPVRLKNMMDLLESGNKAIVLWGPPGTGKTYSAQELVCQRLDISRRELDEYKFTGQADHTRGAWDIVQFHPNYAYEDFIGGISPNLESGNISYTLKQGIFKRMCDEANKEENKDVPFVLIVDEINRADLSAVFGELMYALEYRGDKISIPNFNEPFVIPDNIYLIGTMNSVDKSLATFDLALRRRFGFYKIMPDTSLLPQMLGKTNLSNDSTEDFAKRCETLNREIATNATLQLGEDFQIGHAYFAKIKDFIAKDETIQDQTISSFDLEKLWIYHLEPLLEEYVGNRVDDPSVRNVFRHLKDKFVKG